MFIELIFDMGENVFVAEDMRRDFIDILSGFDGVVSINNNIFKYRVDGTPEFIQRAMVSFVNGFVTADMKTICSAARQVTAAASSSSLSLEEHYNEPRQPDIVLGMYELGIVRQFTTTYVGFAPVELVL